MLRDPEPLLGEGRKWVQMWTRVDDLAAGFGVVLCVLIGLFLATSARADYTQARGIFCDTAEQIEAFVTLVEGETPKQEAMQLINDAAGKDNACVVGNIVFETMTEVKDIINDIVVVKVVIVAIITPHGVIQAELEQFTAIAKSVLHPARIGI